MQGSGNLLEIASCDFAGDSCSLCHRLSTQGHFDEENRGIGENTEGAKRWSQASVITLASLQSIIKQRKHWLGGYAEGVPPDPIPNSEVKSFKAHDSRTHPAKVGSRQTNAFLVAKNHIIDNLLLVEVMMAIDMQPPQSLELKQVLHLHSSIKHAKVMLETKEEDRRQYQRLLKEADNPTSRRIIKDSLVLNGLVIKKYQIQVTQAQKDLKNLPALCGLCEGLQMVDISVSGQMAQVCSACRGDGLTSGPRQRAYQREQNRLLRKHMPEISRILETRLAAGCRNMSGQHQISTKKCRPAGKRMNSRSRIAVR